MSKHLFRPGVTLQGDWAPNCPEYPFHYADPKIGDQVWCILFDKDEEEYYIEPDKIIEISNYYHHAQDTIKYRQENNITPIPEFYPEETYLIDFWLEKYNPGYGVTFGDCIFETFDEAAFVLLQMYSDDFEEYRECIKELQKLRKDYKIEGYF